MIELPFRIAFGILWGVYFITRLYCQRRFTGSGDFTRIRERQENLLFRAFALGFMLLPFYFLTPWIDFASIPLPIWIRWASGAVICGGIVLFGWTHVALGKSWTAVLALASDHKMVQEGPYRRVRHPMYTAFLIIGVGFLLLSANLLVGLVYLVPLIVMVVLRVGPEEQMMLERFGDTYRDYMRHTGRLLPRL